MREGGFNIVPFALSPAAPPQPEFIVVDRPLDRVLAFTGYGIHDIINNPIARNAVYGYFKLHKFVQRRCEIIELERQWNPSKFSVG